jgi:flagellar motor switch/type III secretory pathway protein FliN
VPQGAASGSPPDVASPAWGPLVPRAGFSPPTVEGQLARLSSPGSGVGAVSKQLSQAEIDALLQAVGAQPAGAATPPPLSPQPAWASAGDDVAALLAAALEAAWRPRVPSISVIRADSLPPGFPASPALRVVQLGPAAGQRLWLLWDADGAEAQQAADAFLATLAGDAAARFQELPAETPFPRGGLLLPYRGAGGQVPLLLTLGFEAEGALQALRERVRAKVPGSPGAAGNAPSPPAGGPLRPAALGAELADVEVEASVFVGGGHFTLAELAALRPGSVLTLGQPSEPAVVAVDGRVVALGEVVLLPDDTLGVRLSRIMLGQQDDAEASLPNWMR